ncbi:hypothetical protein BB561_003111 [Smittium simulii]|uniref:Uncharacterized protein n=1 Tax=Smittium simulii TaxID=133385 RepID=A0A2T9YN31_9FUNG|nr:hypothetical protein BB561_003111 [Smittium simulii]
MINVDGLFLISKIDFNKELNVFDPEAVGVYQACPICSKKLKRSYTYLSYHDSIKETVIDFSDIFPTTKAFIDNPEKIFYLQIRTTRCCNLQNKTPLNKTFIKTPLKSQKRELSKQRLRYYLNFTVIINEVGTLLQYGIMNGDSSSINSIAFNSCLQNLFSCDPNQWLLKTSALPEINENDSFLQLYKLNAATLMSQINCVKIAQKSICEYFNKKFFYFSMNAKPFLKKYSSFSQDLSALNSKFNASTIYSISDTYNNESLSIIDTYFQTFQRFEQYTLKLYKNDCDSWGSDWFNSNESNSIISNTPDFKKDLLLFSDVDFSELDFSSINSTPSIQSSTKKYSNNKLQFDSVSFDFGSPTDKLDNYPKNSLSSNYTYYQKSHDSSYQLSKNKNSSINLYNSYFDSMQNLLAQPKSKSSFKTAINSYDLNNISQNSKKVCFDFISDKTENFDLKNTTSSLSPRTIFSDVNTIKSSSIVHEIAQDTPTRISNNKLNTNSNFKILSDNLINSLSIKRIKACNRNTNTSISNSKHVSPTNTLKINNTDLLNDSPRIINHSSTHNEEKKLLDNVSDLHSSFTPLNHTSNTVKTKQQFLRFDSPKTPSLLFDTNNKSINRKKKSSNSLKESQYHKSSAKSLNYKKKLKKNSHNKNNLLDFFIEKTPSPGFTRKFSHNKKFDLIQANLVIPETELKSKR